MDKKLNEQDLLDEIAENMGGLKSLLHLVYEGIRTGSVGMDEILEAVNSLYRTANLLDGQLRQFQWDLFMKDK